MAIYFFIAFLLLIFMGFSHVEKSYAIGLDGSISRVRNREVLFEKRFLILVLALLILFTGLRSLEIGNDTISYASIFDDFKDGNFDSSYRIEIGFQFYCFLIGRFTSDAHIFFLITSFLCYSFFGLYIYKYSKNIPLSLCLCFCFFYPVFINIIRQGIVIILLLYAFSCLSKNKYIPAIILIVIAGLFHATAFIFLLLLLHKVFPRSFKFFVIVFLLSLILSLSPLLSIVTRYIAPQYSHYLGGKYEGTGKLAVFLELLIALFIFLVCFLSFQGSKKNEYSLYYMSNFLLVIICVFGFSINLLTRMTHYFLAVSVISLPSAAMKCKNSRIFSFCIGFFAIAYFFVVMILRPEWSNLYPYHFYWNN